MFTTRHNPLFFSSDAALTSNLSSLNLPFCSFEGTSIQFRMSSFPLSAGISLVSDDVVPTPASVKVRQKGPSVEELDAIELRSYGHVNCGGHNASKPPAEPHTPVEARTSSVVSGTKTPKTPDQIEASLPPTPRQHLATTSVVPSLWYPAMNRWRVLAACLVYLGNGLNDSSPGALIPYIETWYGIGYAVVSLIFITNAVGFILAAFFADIISGRLGRARSLMLSEAFMIVGYTIIACSPPFGVVVAAYLVLGFGNALNLAYNNVFCANLAQPTIILGLAHGSYGIGGVLGPIIATSLVSNGVPWARFYLITIGLRLFCFCLVGWSFWNYEKEGATHFANSLEQIASRQRASELGEPTKLQLLAKALKNRTTIIGAAFIFAYQGGEVADSGWFISYLINYRNGDPAKVGYVTAGFWGGITIGRFVLTHAAHRIGERRFVFGLGLAAVAFQLLAWLVPNVIGDAGECQARPFRFSAARPSLTSSQSPSQSSGSYWARSIPVLRRSSPGCYRAVFKSSRWASSAALGPVVAPWYPSSRVWSRRERALLCCIRSVSRSLF